MLVSAISNSRFFTANNAPIEKGNKSISDNIADTTFNSLTSPNKSNNDKDLAEIYEAINRWKLFCHSQIEAGNLDIIA